MSPEPIEPRTASLLHYNDCTADSGAPCTCEPPLTTVEEVLAVLFACHVLEFIDADSGWACGCDEDGFLELLTLKDAHKHQADATLSVLRPLLAAEALTAARRDISDYRIGLGRNRTHVGPKFQGRLLGLEEAAGKLTTAIKALRTTTPEKEN